MNPDRPTIAVVEPDRLGAVAGELVAEAIASCIAVHGRCRLAVAGGSTPAPAFEWLADNLSADLAGNLVVTTVDERHLPLDDDLPGGLQAEHNLRLLNRCWLARTSTPPRVLSMVRSGSLTRACASYSEDFAELGGLDVLLLGMGPDGHIASLFPGHPGLDASGVCLAIHDSPKPPPERLTLTMHVLQAAPVAVLMATGAAKAEALSGVLAGDERWPVARLRPRQGWHWVLDAAAAGELDRP